MKIDNIDFMEGEAGFTPQVIEVFQATGGQVVETNHLGSPCQQSIAKMGSEKPGRPCDKNTTGWHWLYSLCEV
jgi:hypothetical protein